MNRVFLPLLGAMALANLLSHLQLLDVLGGLGDMRRVMLDLILLIIALVAGRVMPFLPRTCCLASGRPSGRGSNA